ncbi:RND family transporter [Chloroflexota bacterium]
MEKIANFVYSKSRLIIILVAILNIIAFVSFFRFELDTDFLSFFTSGNPRAEEFDRLKEKYETGEAIAVLIEQEDSLLDKENLLKVFRLQDEIEKLDGISTVESFIPTEIPIGRHTFEVDEKFIDHHSDILEDFIEEKYFLTTQFLSPDNSKAILIANLEFNAAAEEVAKSLEKVVKNEEVLTLSLAGNEIIKDTLLDYLTKILYILPPCTIGLILLVFFSILRNLRFTIMAIIPAGLGALWTVGTVFWSGHELNLVTVISPIFVVVMGAADGLHFTSHFMDNMSRYSDRRQLIIETLRFVGMPIFLTSITTMAGFASLTWTEVLPMRQMGIYVTLGIGYAGVLSLFFLPAVLSRIKLPPEPPQARESHLARLTLTASRHRAPIIISFLAIMVFSAFYIPGLEVVSNQLIQRLLTHIDDEDLETWVSDNGLRMMIRTEDLVSLDIDRLEDFVAEQPDIRVISGMPVLFDEMNRLVVQSQIRSLGLALVMVFIMLLVTTRKPGAALVAILPVIITIAAILGMLSISNFNLNILTANLSAIAVGVGVDYSIHLISGIYYFQKQGLGNIDSVDSALSSLSRPILANAFGLAIGLSILFFSPLRIHIQAASVMWVAMVVSSLGSLLLIPIFYSKPNQQPKKKAQRNNEANG